jgi:hypothetical protein
LVEQLKQAMMIRAAKMIASWEPHAPQFIWEQEWSAGTKVHYGTRLEHLFICFVSCPIGCKSTVASTVLDKMIWFLCHPQTPSICSLESSPTETWIFFLVGAVDGLATPHSPDTVLRIQVLKMPLWDLKFSFRDAWDGVDLKFSFLKGF